MDDTQLKFCFSFDFLSSFSLSLSFFPSLTMHYFIFIEQILLRPLTFIIEKNTSFIKKKKFCNLIMC